MGKARKEPLTEEEARENRRIFQAMWRARNREKSREYIREYMKKYRATRRGAARLKAAQDAYTQRIRERKEKIVKPLWVQLDLELTD